MSFSNAAENDILDLLFTATAIADLAQDDASSPATSLYVSLHTSDPGETGNQTTNETTYTDYLRVAVARTAGGWTVSGNSVSPAATISFPQCTGGTATVTHIGLGTGASGAGYMIMSGTCTPNIFVSNLVTPRLTTATAITLD